MNMLEPHPTSQSDIFIICYTNNHEQLEASITPEGSGRLPTTLTLLKRFPFS